MKKTIIIYISILFILMGCSDNVEDVNWPNITTEAKPWTRWWWMGSVIDKANLTYNLEELSKAGIGGVEITPVYGVQGQESNYIDYLSPKWMEMLAYTQSESIRLGMLVDMNMGTGWPFGGREISIEDAATKAIFQEYILKKGQQLKEPIEVKDEKQKAVAQLKCLMAYASDGEKLDLTSKVLDNGQLEWIAQNNKDWKLIALFTGKTFQRVKRSAPGAEGYVMDHLNINAINRYFDKFEKAFLSSNTSFPNSFFNDSYEVYGANWTSDMLNEFERRRGYKLEEYFPELLADGVTDTSARIIADYRETISEMLRDNFTNIWTKWCNERGISTRNQAHGSPANLIDIYASVDIPECESFGITDFDIPGLRKDSIRKENDSDPTILKYASSAAHITGKKYTSAETFTWLTEHFRTSLSQCKPEIDQMFTSGVNHVFFHGATYSPKDAEWPGWKFYASMDMSPTNTIWRDAPAFFDYITRTQSFLQLGEPDNDFLLYLPIYDIWEEQRGSFFTTFAIHGMRERLPQFCNAVDEIMKCGYDLDYISDHFIQTSTVENGLLRTEGGASYKALILPSVKLIPLETLSHIKRLAEQGATIIFEGKYPTDISGFSKLEERKASFNDLLTKFPKIDSFSIIAEQKIGKGSIITGNEYEALLSKFKENKEVFTTKFGGQYIRRKHMSGYHYFFTMLSNKTLDNWIPISVKAESAMFFDPLSGSKGKAKLRQQNGRTEVYMQLKPGESIILKTFDRKTINTEDWVYYKATGKNMNLTKNWEMKFVESDPIINNNFHLTSLGSWTDLGLEEVKNNKGTARYKVIFHLDKKEGMEYQLCLGDVRESARIYVNGASASTLFAVPFDSNIGSLLTNGTNLLEIEVTNLPANRISDYDKRDVKWRIFNDINFVSITYANEKFDKWNTVPSGLLGPVVIKELKKIDL